MVGPEFDVELLNLLWQFGEGAKFTIECKNYQSSLNLTNFLCQI